MGALQVPTDALWGAQTQRVVQNFSISGLTMPRPFILALDPAALTRGGTPDTGGKRGKLAAIDVRTLLGTSVQGFPVSFSAGGKQSVAISTGTGGESPRRAPRALTPEIRHPEHGNALYVFALPD